MAQTHKHYASLLLSLLLLLLEDAGVGGSHEQRVLHGHDPRLVPALVPHGAVEREHARVRDAVVVAELAEPSLCQPHVQPAVGVKSVGDADRIRLRGVGTPI